MFKKKKPLSARGERRSNERLSQKEIDARKAIVRASEGGSPERPMQIASSAVVEVRALSLGCGVCGGELRLRDHRIEGDLRITVSDCRDCATARTTYFLLAGRVLN